MHFFFQEMHCVGHGWNSLGSKAGHTGQDLQGIERHAIIFHINCYYYRSFLVIPTTTVYICQPVGQGNWASTWMTSYYSQTTLFKGHCQELRQDLH